MVGYLLENLSLSNYMFVCGCQMVLCFLVFSTEIITKVPSRIFIHMDYIEIQPILHFSTQGWFTFFMFIMMHWFGTNTYKQTIIWRNTWKYK